MFLKSKKLITYKINTILRNKAESFSVEDDTICVVVFFVNRHINFGVVSRFLMLKSINNPFSRVDLQ